MPLSERRSQQGPKKSEILTPLGFMRRLCKDVLQQKADSGDWSNFATFAESIAIISADRVEVPSPGVLKLTQSPKPLTRTPELPQVREY